MNYDKGNSNLPQESYQHESNNNYQFTQTFQNSPKNNQPQNHQFSHKHNPSISIKP